MAWMLRIRCLAAMVVMAGCARSDYPVIRYEIPGKPANIAACIFRDAQQNIRTLHLVNQAHLEDPEEHQVSKSFEGTLVWEVDATAGSNGGTLLVMRHHPSLVSWDADALKSVNACAGSAALRRV